MATTPESSAITSPIIEPAVEPAPPPSAEPAGVAENTTETEPSTPSESAGPSPAPIAPIPRPGTNARAREVAKNIPVATRPPRDSTQTIMAITIALLIITSALSVLSLLKVNDLEKKLNSAEAARQSTNDRITILEGAQKNLIDQEQALQGKFDAQAAADPTVISNQVQGSVYTVSTNESLGSAWVAASDHTTAKFVTNYHVIADAWERGEKTVQVFQDKGQVYDGTIEQALPDVDLALIAVKADIPKLKQSSETPRPGQTIIVIGSPLGLGGSVSTGAVSALREEDGINYIQFAAPISPGNSGGPIVNSLGEVIGITEASAGIVIQGAENANFALPVNLVCIRLQAC